MTIRQFNRDTAYFQIMRDRSMMLNAEDLDFEFNDLADYLNKKIVPLINTLAKREIPGVNDPALEDACLLNVGDGSTKWVKVVTNEIADFSVPFNKLLHDHYNEDGTNFGAVIATNNAGIFTAVTPEQEGDVFFSVRENLPIWRKIKTGDIKNGSITGMKLALNSVGIEHLPAQLVGFAAIPQNSILNHHIVNQSLDGSKLKNYCAIGKKLSKSILDKIDTDKNNIEFTQYLFEPKHFSNNLFIQTYKDERSNKLVNTVLGKPVNVIQTRRNIAVDDDVYYTFNSEHILYGSITIQQLAPMLDLPYTNPPSKFALDISRCFARGSVTHEHIKDYTVHLGGKLYTNNLIRKEKLHRSIREKLGI